MPPTKPLTHEQLKELMDLTKGADTVELKLTVPHEHRARGAAALGAAIVQTVEGAASLSPEERHARGINHSSIHTDFMIGSNDLEVVGVTADGDEVPILGGGEWLL